MSGYAKIKKATSFVLYSQPWYGAFLMDFEYVKSNSVPTMGVQMTRLGVRLLWNEEFVDKIPLFNLAPILVHEVEHVVRMHLVRRATDGLHLIENYAKDMTCNGSKKENRIKIKIKSQEMVMPDFSVFIPENWEQNETWEFYYKKLMEMFKEEQQKSRAQKGKGKGKDNSKGNGKGDKNKDQEGDGGGGKSEEDKLRDFLKQFGEALDDIAEAAKACEVSEDEARQMVKEMADNATSTAPGSVPGHLSEALEKLLAPKVRWREELKAFTGKNLGNRRLSWAKINRRMPQFGFRGHSRRNAAKVAIVTDTSGSISNKMLEGFFTEIENISHGWKIHLLQWDHDFQGYNQYRRGDWRKLKVNGRGGTDMMAPIDWLKKNASFDAIILFTDGECYWGEDPQVPIIICIAGEEDQRYYSDPPEWGKTIFVDR